MPKAGEAMITTLRETEPICFLTAPFSAGRTAVDLHAVKRAYTYKFMYFSAGKVGFHLPNKTEICSAGTLVYLLPGETYRILPESGDFRVVSVYFYPVAHEPPPGYCIFEKRFQPQLCFERADFSDAPHLNTSCILHGLELDAAFRSLCANEQTDNPYAPLHRQNTLRCLLGTVALRAYEAEANAVKTPLTAQAAKILAYIDNTDTDVCELSAGAIADKFGYHPNYVNALVKRRTNLTLKQYILKSKVARAKILLSETDLPVSEIAQQLGFFDHSHFCKTFRAEVGESPAAFRFH